METRFMAQRVAYVVLFLVGFNVYQFVGTAVAEKFESGWIVDAIAFVVAIVAVHLVNRWFHKPASTIYRG